MSYLDKSVTFFDHVLDVGCLWGLQDDEGGWALSASVKHENSDVMPFWSKKELAQCHISGEWSHYQIVPIALDEFVEQWLPGMHEDVILVGLDWDENLEGDEFEPLDLLEVFERDNL